jgi:hypothetical protein
MKALASFVLVLTLCASSNAQQVGQVARGEAPNDASTRTNKAAACLALRSRGADFQPLAVACEHALELPHTLPDLVFTEKAVRRFSPKKNPDIITAEVTIQRMHSNYADVTVNCKNQSAPFLSGTEFFAEQVSSTGELAHLFNVFNEASQTEFAPPVDSSTGGKGVKRYDFRVKRENNTAWTWFFVRRAMNPGYHGSIYVDGRSGQVVQLNLQVTSDEMDAETPIAQASTTLEYAVVALGTAGTRHLPIRGQNTSCFRGVLGCVEVKLSFSNFHLFRADTRIIP